MSKQFFIADTHFGHNRIIEYEERPFKTVQEMDETLIRNWNSVVGKFDRTYVLGDFSFYGKQETTALLSRLKGTKVLVMGNHDRHKTYSWWISVGFNEVYKYPILFDQEQRVMLSHEPVSHNWQYNLIHGHLHTHGSLYDDARMFNVSVERINYTPILYERVLDRLNEKAIAKFKVEYECEWGKI